MRKIYFLLLCFFALTSCRPRLITRGITDKTTTYVVTDSGRKVNTSSLNIHDGTVTTDSATYPLKTLSAIKTGESYYGVKNGNLYDGVYYGKLVLLRRNEGMYYDMNSHRYSANYNYYLQKLGEPGILNLNTRNLIASVEDNPLALRKARASRIFGTVSIVSAATAISGLACVFLPYSSPIRKPAVTAGLFSMPVFLITLPITSHKRYKSIIVYDR